MRLSRPLAIVAFIAAIAAPLGASAATTYNFTIPVRLTGMQPNAYFQWSCAVGSAAVVNPTGNGGLNFATNFELVGSSYSGNTTATATSATPEHTYKCVLYQMINGGLAPGLATFSPTSVQVSGTM